jgi:hypothetical protein
MARQQTQRIMTLAACEVRNVIALFVREKGINVIVSGGHLIALQSMPQTCYLFK